MGAGRMDYEGRDGDKVGVENAYAVGIYVKE